eukprot:10168676-Prorocentrum_lima.AAC.1
MLIQQCTRRRVNGIGAAPGSGPAQLAVAKQMSHGLALVVWQGVEERTHHAPTFQNECRWCEPDKDLQGHGRSGA